MPRAALPLDSVPVDERHFDPWLDHGLASVVETQKTTPEPDQRPRLLRGLVAIRRPDGHLQIEADSESWLIADAPDCAEAIIARLDGRHSLRALSRPEHRPWAVWFVDLLRTYGLLAASAPAGVHDVVRVVGGGSIARRVCTALVLHGVDVRVNDPTPSPTGRGTTADELVSRIRREKTSFPGLLTVDHANDTDAPVDLTVVCSPHCEPSRDVTDALTKADQPHLVVRSRPGVAVAGPLVVPGLGSCLRCADLRVVAHDDTWPYVLCQLARTPVQPHLVTTGWLVSTAVGQIMAYLGGKPYDTFSSTLELSAACPGRVEHRYWPVRADCGCTRLA